MRGELLEDLVGVAPPITAPIPNHASSKPNPAAPSRVGNARLAAAQPTSHWRRTRMPRCAPEPRGVVEHIGRSAGQRESRDHPLSREHAGTRLASPFVEHNHHAEKRYGIKKFAPAPNPATTNPPNARPGRACEVEVDAVGDRPGGPRRAAPVRE